MDQFTRYYLGMVFRLRFIDARGDNFQVLFGQIMNFRYPGDFIQTRPWGSLGDNKCDGYLPSQKKFYQCYAPDDLNKKQTLKKLREDFAGALPYKNKFFDVWVFVHNARDGRIPSWLALELNRLNRKCPDVKIETIGYLELLQEVFKLGLPQLVDFFGPFPSQRDLLALKFEDIIPLLKHVSHQTAPIDLVPKPVSPEKLKYNHLSESVQCYLRSGMIKANMVKDYFDRNPDKELGAHVTKAFREEYERLRQQETDADEIFFGLRAFAQGLVVQTPKVEVAVLAVLAYLFEECDIFENPPIS